MANRILRADSTQPSLICRTAKYLAGVLAGVGLTLGGASGILAQADDEITPAPPSIGADVPVTYFGPTPSSVQRELVGPFQNLKAGKVDLDRGTITFPSTRAPLRAVRFSGTLSRTPMTRGTRKGWG